VIFAATVWTAAGLGARAPVVVPSRLRGGALALLGLILLQLYLGALVAGLRAGLIYNTWPLIDGSLIPDSAQLLHDTPAWRNLFENTLTVQFNHRMAAYAIFILAWLHAFDALATLRRGAVVGHALGLALVVTLQVALGILTLLHLVPIGLALTHQAVAIVALTIAVVHAQRLAAPPRIVLRESSAPAR
jgi:cytochrome c oxidase assembly protein subunit 15